MQEAIGVSSDSDFFFRLNIQVVCKLNPNRDTIVYWKVDKIRERLGLSKI
jgi:hypothetical protein